MPRIEGHKAGVKRARQVIKSLSQHGVKYATLYAFSTENWNRPEDEVSALLRLLEESIDKEATKLHRIGVRVLHLGRPEGLPEGLCQSIRRAAELTGANTRMTVSIAFNYGGRREILDAVQRLITEGVPPLSIDEKLFSRYLYTAGLPDVDLVIRTGGEIRISNFLVWQSAYSEFYFTPVLWPDFDEEELEKALLSYSQRERRFGGL